MTRALHELINTSPVRNTEDEARILDELSKQFKETAAQITQEHAVKPEDVEDLREASKYLSRRLGRLSLSELLAEMDAAVASDDKQSLENARTDLLERFPQDAPNPGLARANMRSIMDYEKAIQLAQQNGTLVSSEIANAAGMNDKELGANFDETIAISNWTMQEQRGELDEENRPALEELRQREADRLEVLRRREEERQKLKDMDESFDDAVPYDPFADDDDEDLAA
jgi:hypothetical protein